MPEACGIKPAQPLLLSSSPTSAISFLPHSNKLFLGRSCIALGYEAPRCPYNIHPPNRWNTTASTALLSTIPSHLYVPTPLPTFGVREGRCDTSNRLGSYMPGLDLLWTVSYKRETSISVFDITTVYPVILTHVCFPLPPQITRGLANSLTVDMDTVNSTERLAHLRQLMRIHKVDIYSEWVQATK